MTSQTATAPEFLNASEAEKFVQQTMFKHNIRDVKDARTVCIDGRPVIGEAEDKLPLLTKPGGNAGELMAALAACNHFGIKDNDRVYTAFLEAIGGPENFTFHTDDSNNDNEPGMGCGHLKNSRNNPESYNLTGDQMEFIFGKLPEILNNGGEQIICQGKHAEKAILLIESDSWGVRAFLPSENSEGTQAFVYHQFLDGYRQDDIGRALHAEFSRDQEHSSEQEFIQAVKVATKKQLDETASRIAAGLPLFSVRINDGGVVSITALS